MKTVELELVIGRIPDVEDLDRAGQILDVRIAARILAHGLDLTCEVVAEVRARSPTRIHATRKHQISPRGQRTVATTRKHGNEAPHVVASNLGLVGRFRLFSVVAPLNRCDDADTQSHCEQHGLHAETTSFWRGAPYDARVRLDGGSW